MYNIGDVVKVNATGPDRGKVGTVVSLGNPTTYLGVEVPNNHPLMPGTHVVMVHDYLVVAA